MNAPGSYPLPEMNLPTPLKLTEPVLAVRDLVKAMPNGMWRELRCPRQGFFAQRRLSVCNAITIPLAVGSHWLVRSEGITEAVATAGGQVGHDGLVKLLEFSVARRQTPST